MRQWIILCFALLLPLRCGGADASFGIRSFAAGGTHSVVLAFDRTVWT